MKKPKTDILSKPNRRGKKRKRLPHTNAYYRQKYNEIKDNVIWQGKWVVIESLPEELREWYSRKRYHDLYRSTLDLLSKRSTRLSWDKKVFLHKYYPWCYKNYIPQVVLQGWYDVKIAKKKYKKIYGPDALRYIKFIKGRSALEKGFSVGKSIYVNGRWQRPFAKVMVSLDYKYMNRVKTAKAKSAWNMIFGYKSSKTSSKFKERALFRWQFYEQYGYKYKEDAFLHLSEEEKLRVQKIQEDIQRAKDLFLEE